MSPSASPAAPHRQPRVLACVLCQHRKIKCDRNSPCSNCIKANVTCVPSTPAPARKRRRPNQDLQERLARCEALLKQYADAPGPDQPQPAPQTTTPTISEPLMSERSDSAPPTIERRTYSELAGRMVNDDGSVRFMDSYIWSTVYEELQAMRDIVETEDPEDASILGSEELTPENNTDLFFAGDLSTANIADLVPEPIHALKLWQLFLDRVNPLFKAIHVPTLQPIVLEAAINMLSLPHHQQALLFSIYTTASLSMSESESLQVLGMSREEAVHKFLAGTKVALLRFNFLKNYNMTALQALVLYMHSLQGRYDRHASWVLSGTLVRIAQKMGYHRDGEKLGLDMYETEMRRRLWWQIIIQDSKNAMFSGLIRSSLPFNWDAKLPSNVNDADIYPGSTEKVRARDGPTEMGFVLILNEIYKFKIQMDEQNSSPACEAAILGHDLAQDQEVSNVIMQNLRADFMALESRLTEMEEKYIDVNASNVHKAAKSLRRAFMGKIAEIIKPLRQQAEDGTEIVDGKGNLFNLFLIGTEQRLDQYETMWECGFLWFVKSYFQLDVFAVITGQLCQRPGGTFADRGWAVVERVYRYHDELFDLSSKQHLMQAQITLKAWRVREQHLLQNGPQLETPPCIQRLRKLLPSADSRASTFSSSDAGLSRCNQNDGQGRAAALFQPDVHCNSPIQQQQQQKNMARTQEQLPQMEGGVDPFVGGLFDMSNINWDLLDGMINTQDQLSMGMFGYGGFSAANHGVLRNNNVNNVDASQFQ